MDGPNIFRHLTAVFLLLCLATAAPDPDAVFEGVNLVTEVNNNLLPALLGPLSASNKNVLLGLFGVTSNLAMLLEATADDSKAHSEILKVLAISDAELRQLRIGFQAYCRLYQELPSDADSAGSFNAASYSKHLKLDTNFETALDLNFCANLTSKEGSDADADAGAVLRLESEAGVLSHWKDSDKLAVYTFLSFRSQKPFTRSDGTSVAIPMIPQVGMFKAAVWRGSQVVLIPLESKVIDLLLIMPEKQTSMSKLVKSLNSRSLSRTLHELKLEELEVFIPQLTSVSSETNLEPVLRSRGLNFVFNAGQANLSKVQNGTDDLFVKSIQQQAFVSLSFTSFKAVSSVSTELTSRKRKKRSANKIYFDRPFLYLILHRHTNLVLLAGKIEDPTQVPN